MTMGSRSVAELTTALEVAKRKSTSGSTPSSRAYWTGVHDTLDALMDTHEPIDHLITNSISSVMDNARRRAEESFTDES